MAAPQSA